MDFSRLSFWLALGAALPVLWFLNALLRRRDAARQAAHKVLLLVLSLLLLGMVSTETLLIFMAVMLLAYAVCRAGVRLSPRGRKVLLGVLVPVLLLPLGYYKYAYFLGVTVLHGPWDSLRDMVIPVGISFYTFQILGFCIDTLLRGLPVPPLLDYMNFCAFFPQIVAGPIERREDLLPQVQRPDLRLRAENVDAGVRYVVLGLFFKLALADNLAAAWLPHYTGGSALHLWLNTLIFTFRIYFDFAGYALSAYGIARCLGITLQMNFLSPYTATDMGELWRRWNATLLRWFRDYVYFPLGGSRTRLWALNIMIVFLISGIWHGAGWNYILWGAYLGATIVLCRSFRLAGGHLPAFAGWLLTFGGMVVSFLIFTDTDMALFARHLKLLATPSAYGAGAFGHELTAMKTEGSMAAPFLVLSALMIAAELVSRRRTGDPYRLFLSNTACAAMVFLMVLLVPAATSSFIYFAF